MFLLFFFIIQIFIFSTPQPVFIDTYQINIRPFPPMTRCTPGRTGIQSDSSFSGYSIEFLRLVLSSMKVSNALFSCKSEYDVEKLLPYSTDKYSLRMAEGSFKISSSILKKGYLFSQPTFHSELKFLVRKNEDKDIWSFLKPLTWEVTMLFATFNIIIGIMIWAYEENNWRRSKKEHFINLNVVIYDTFSSYYATNAISLNNLASKFIQWTFWLTFVIFIAIYQANLTSKLAASYYNLEITSFEKARAQGKRIAVMKDFMQIVDDQFPSKNSYISYDSNKYGVENTTLSMLTALSEEKSIDGLLLETPLADYYSTRFCNIIALDTTVIEFNYGTVFAQGTDINMILEFSKHVIKVKESYETVVIQRKFFQIENAGDCSDSQASTKISMDQLAGLWVILLCSVVLAFAIFVIKKLGWIKMHKNYLSPYYNYYNEKTELFENQLKEAAEYELNKIVGNYHDKIMKEIDFFEKCLLLQEDFEQENEFSPSIKEGEDKKGSEQCLIMNDDIFKSMKQVLEIDHS